MIMSPPGAFPGGNGAVFLPRSPRSPLRKRKNSLPAAVVIQGENHFVCLPLTFLAPSSARPHCYRILLPYPPSFIRSLTLTFLSGMPVTQPGSDAESSDGPDGYHYRPYGWSSRPMRSHPLRIHGSHPWFFRPLLFRRLIHRANPGSPIAGRGEGAAGWVQQHRDETAPHSTATSSQRGEISPDCCTYVVLILTKRKNPDQNPGFYVVFRVFKPCCWRKGRDSNPRYGLTRTNAFQAFQLNHSCTFP